MSQQRVQWEIAKNWLIRPTATGRAVASRFGSTACRSTSTALLYPSEGDRRGAAPEALTAAKIIELKPFATLIGHPYLLPRVRNLLPDCVGGNDCRKQRSGSAYKASSQAHVRGYRATYPFRPLSMHKPTWKHRLPSSRRVEACAKPRMPTITERRAIPSCIDDGTRSSFTNWAFEYTRGVAQL